MAGEPPVAVGDAALLGGVARVGDRRRRRVGRRRHDDVEGLAGGEAAEIGGRDLDAERADSAAAGVPLKVRVAALKVSQAGSAEPSAAVAV